MKKFQFISIKKENSIKHFFKTEHGFIVENLRFRVKWAKFNPKKMRLHIQIWLPLIHVVRDNVKWEIGNRHKIFLYH